MLHTTQGIKLSDKEYHELHFVVLNDTRFKIFGLTRDLVQKLGKMTDEAGLDRTTIPAETLDNYEIISKERLKELEEIEWQYKELCK